MGDVVQRILVWPTLIRLLHLLMSFCVLVLLVTGSFLSSGLIVNDALFNHLLSVWHLPAGNVLAFVLLARLILLLTDHGVASWRAWMPKEMTGILTTLSFYMGMARGKLPAYFAHNPFWKLLYFVMFVLLVIQTFYGLLIEFSTFRSIMHLGSSFVREQHRLFFEPIFMLVFAHVVTVLLHDWKTDTGEVSSMINGYKHFSFNQKTKFPAVEMPVSVPLDQLFTTSLNQKSKKNKQ